MRRILATLALAGLIGCGGDSGAPPAGLSGTFVMARGDATQPCAEVSAVRSVEAIVKDQNGLPLARYPTQSGDCETGRFTLDELPSGEYTLEMLAKGVLGPEQGALLYRAEVPLTVPSAGPIEVVLMPEVSFFDLSWSFGTTGELAPCSDEVETVEVFISAGGSSAFQGSFACAETPQALDVLLAPRMYTVLVQAKSSARIVVYSVTESRLLQRGPNEYHALMEPLGGRLSFDWQFVVGSGPAIQGCDDARVSVDDIDTIVSGQTGGDVVEERTACSTARPYTMNSSRFTQGRALEIELRADGEHAFLAKRSFTMPAGDHELPLLTLQAVGSATIAWTSTSSSPCALATIDEYTLTLTDQSTQDVERAATYAGDTSSASLTDVAYGVYEVEVVGFQGQTERCRGQAPLMVDGRENSPLDVSL